MLFWCSCSIAFTRIKSISDAMELSFNVPTLITAILLTITVAFITIGGIKRIASVAEKIIPLMCLLYIGGVIIILITHLNVIPQVIESIIESAFSTQVSLGGDLGGRNQSRNFFNESGLGRAPIAAAAKTHSCVEQGLVSMTGTFIDTVVICTMTGIAILLTNSHTGGLEGAAMTSQAFSNGLFISIIGKYWFDFLYFYYDYWLELLW